MNVETSSAKQLEALDQIMSTIQQTNLVPLLRHLIIHSISVAILKEATKDLEDMKDKFKKFMEKEDGKTT